ncbi:MAG: GAF domain-containing protein [Salinivirgaceae bacterium]|jgi:methyl-accepting chemotaxis protein|nr:GAF domain-containing protein [Bacteroidales bacterium]
MKNFSSRSRKKNLSSKLIAYTTLVVIVVLIPVLIAVSIKRNQETIDSIKKTLDAVCSENAYKSQIVFKECQSSAYFLKSIIETREYTIEEKRAEYIENNIARAMVSNANILAIWCIFQNEEDSVVADTSNINDTHKNNFNFAYYRLSNKVKKLTADEDSKTNEITDLAINKVKASGISALDDPRLASYSNNNGSENLVANFTVPIIKNNVFKGVVSVDISLESLISKTTSSPDSYAILLSNKGTVALHPDDSQNGRNITNLEQFKNMGFNFLKYVEAGKPISFITDRKESYVTIFPIKINDDIAPWALCLITPLDNILKSNNEFLIFSIVAGILGLILALVIIYLIIKRVLSPTKLFISVFDSFSRGVFDESQKIILNTNDELYAMSCQINQLIDNMNTLAKFATEMSKGNLDAEFKPLSESDIIGNALIDIRENKRILNKREAEQKLLDDRKQWSATGINKVSEILRQHSQSMSQLTFSALKFTMEYVDAVQGGVYVKNYDTEDDLYFEMTAAIAFGREKIAKGKIKLEEGLVGRCASEKLTIYLTEIPDNYPRIKSGLGNATPNVIVLVPMKTNEEVLGVVELISFKEYEDFEIEFLEKVGDDMAVTVANVITNQKTVRLLEQSQRQSKALALKEEQARQTLEELNATQEEARHRIEQISSLVSAVNQISMVSEYDIDGYLTDINDNFLRLLGVDRQQIIGKKQGSFDKVENREKNDKMWAKLRKGETVTSVQIIDAGFKNIVLSETYVPVKDSQGKILKVINIAIDITHSYGDKNVK